MADVAMHEQAIGIDDDRRAISRDPSGADPVSIDTSVYKQYCVCYLQHFNVREIAVSYVEVPATMHISSQALPLGLLAPANSTHLRSVQIWWCTGPTWTQVAG